MAPTTARLFDAMADDYDELEPWYEHLYAVLHPLLLDALAPATGPSGYSEERHGFAGACRASGGPEGPSAGPPMSPIRALDAGCGTGFQTTLLQRLGYESHGVDIAGRLLAVARRRLASSRFALASIESLPYRDRSFDAIACCGSTLSFVDDPHAALRELSRVLRPGGRLLIECEHRFSADLGWTLVSAVSGDRLGYGLSAAEAWRQLTCRPREGYTVTYPSYGRLRLFSGRELASMLTAAGLHPLRRWGIHTITNLIPSTVLHRGRLGRVTAALYARLRVLDARLSASSLAPRVANSLVVLAEKPRL